MNIYNTNQTEAYLGGGLKVKEKSYRKEKKLQISSNFLPFISRTCPSPNLISKYAPSTKTFYINTHRVQDKWLFLSCVCPLSRYLYLLQVGRTLGSMAGAGEDLIPGSDIRDNVECRTINKRNANAVPC